MGLKWMLTNTLVGYPIGSGVWKLTTVPRIFQTANARGGSATAQTIKASCHLQQVVGKKALREENQGYLKEACDSDSSGSEIENILQRHRKKSKTVASVKHDKSTNLLFKKRGPNILACAKLKHSTVSTKRLWHTTSIDSDRPLLTGLWKRQVRFKILSFA